jgi:hypothetical protein
MVISALPEHLLKMNLPVSHLHDNADSSLTFVALRAVLLADLLLLPPQGCGIHG